MFEQVMSVGFLIGILTMLFVTPGMYMRGIYKIEYDTLTTTDKILSWIPIVNVAKAERLYTGSVSKVCITSLTFIFTLGLRIAAIFAFPDDVRVQTVTVISLIITMLSAYAMNVYAVFIVLNDAGVGSMLSRILRSALYPLGQYYIGAHMATVVKNIRRMEAEDEFAEA